MTQGAQVDYDALAKQAGAISSQPPQQGGAVDYDALAKRAGAIRSQPSKPDFAASPPSVPDPKSNVNTLMRSDDPSTRTLWGFGETVHGMPGASEGANLAEGLGATGAGMLKGAGKTVSTVSKGLNKLPFLGQYLAPRQGITALDNMTTLNDPGEMMGAGLEQAGEMALTGGPLKTGATALASKLPFLGRFAAPALRIGAEALNTGGSAALHDQPVGQSAAIGGGGAAVGEVLPFLAPWLKQKAVGQYQRALAPTTKVNKAIAQKIAPEMLDRGISGGLGSIEEQAATAAAPLKAPLDTAYQALPASATAGSGTKILSDLDQLKARYVVNGVVSQPAAVNAIEGVQDIIRQHGADISPTSLRQLKQVFADPVAARGGYAGADLATQYAVQAQKGAANSIRNILHQASPDIAALDKEMSFWLDVKKVTGASGLRRTGQEGGLTKVFAPLAAGLAGSAGYAAGGASGGIEAALGTAGTAAVIQVVRSPAWRTFTAVQKNLLADALASGSAGAVSSALTRLGVAGLGQNAANNGGRR